MQIGQSSPYNSESDEERTQSDEHEGEPEAAPQSMYIEPIIIRNCMSFHLGRRSIDNIICIA